MTAILLSGSNKSKEQSLGGSHLSQHHGIKGSESLVFMLKDTPCVDKVRRKSRANAFEHRTGREVIEGPIWKYEGPGAGKY